MKVIKFLTVILLVFIVSNCDTKEVAKQIAYEEYEKLKNELSLKIKKINNLEDKINNLMQENRELVNKINNLKKENETKLKKLYE
jgi:predicted  nucleic acid-binding Zn-ribbon protein